MTDLDENKIHDGGEQLVKMVSSNLEVLVVDYYDGDEMQENANWVMKLGSLKLKFLCR